MRIARFVVLLAFAAACSDSQRREGTRSADLAAPPAVSGNGPQTMVVCNNPNGFDPLDCRPARAITAATLTAALTPPPAAFDSSAFDEAFPFVHSWALGGPVNFSSYVDGAGLPSLQSNGLFHNESATPDATTDIDDRTLFPGALTAAPQNYARVLTGWLFVPAGAADVLKTIGVGSNDGAFFAIQTCAQSAAAAPACNGQAATSVVTISDLGGHLFGYAAKAIAFPKAGGLFPFQLASFQTSGSSGLELAWADGAVAAPICDAPGCTDASGAFKLIPASSIYAPDVRATLSATAAGALAAGGSLTYTANVKNVGLIPAFPPTGGAAGLQFTLAIPRAVLPATPQFTVQVNGVAATPAVTSNLTNTLLTVPFKTPGSSANTLLDGTSATISVTTTLRSGLAPGTAFSAQGRITGHGTDPVVLAGQTVAPASTIYVLTDNASLDTALDSGNAPAGLAGNLPEAAPVATQTFVSAAQGNADDDPLLLKIGVHTPGAAIAHFLTDPVSSATVTALQGTAFGPAPVNVRVMLDAAQSICAAAGADWSWTGTTCACANASTADDGPWQCSALFLPVGSYHASAQVTDPQTGETAGAADLYAFRVGAPVATISSPANGTTVNSHSITPSGTASSFSGGPAAPNGAAVTATITGGGSCSGPVAADGSWTCSAPIALAADGSYSISAQVRQADGSLAPAAPASTFIADTRPTLTRPAGGITNSATPVFGGQKIGDGPAVRVCFKSDPACAAPVCVRSGVAAASWSCQAASAIPSGIYVAYEIDAGGNPSAPSADFALIVNGAPATVANVPVNKLFNLARNPFAFQGTCASGESVSAAFLTSAGAPWPSPGAQAACSSPCGSSGWSCSIRFPQDGNNLTLAVSERAPDNSATTPPATTTTGITVDVTPPANATVQVTPALVIAGSPNPPAVSGSGEDGASVAVAASGTTRAGGHAVTASCTGTIVVSGGAWSCSAWDVIDTVTAAHGAIFPDGNYAITASETDANGNPQVGAPASARLTVKTLPPPPPSLSVKALSGGADPNPPAASGTGEAGDGLAVTLSGAAGTRACATMVASSGNWSCSSWAPAAPLLDGTYTASATQTDSFGNVSAAATQSFAIDLTPPLAPTAVVPLEAAAGFTPNRTPVVGAVPAESGGTVSIVVKDAAGIPKQSCANLGAAPFACAVAAPLADGIYSIEARQTDAAGNVSAAGSASFHVDATTPAVPVFNAPSSPTLLHQPAFLGTGYPGSGIAVKDSRGNLLCTTSVSTAGSTGAYRWTCAPAALDDLDYSLAASGLSPNGAGSSSPVSLQVRSYVAPALTGPATTSAPRPALSISGDGAARTALIFEGGAQVCATSLSGGAGSCAGASWAAPLAIGDHAFTAELRDGATPPHRSLPSSPLLLAVLPAAPLLTSTGTLGTNQPLLIATSTNPGAAVTFADDATATQICAAVAGADGSAACQVGAATPGVTLADGTHALRLTASAGGKSSSSTGTIVIDATPSLVQLATPTRDALPSLCIAAKPGVPQGTVGTVIDAAHAVCTAVFASGDAQSCCHPAGPLEDGGHLLAAELQFPPGGFSARSLPFSLTVKTHTRAPLFTTAENAVFSSSVMLSGTAEPGATVVLSIDGRARPPLTAAGDGGFADEIGALATGTHVAQAVATDSLGNQASSDPRHFSVSLGGHVEGSALGCSSAEAAGWTLLLPLLALALRRRKSAALAACVALASAARAGDLALDHFRPASGSDGAIGTEGARPPADGDEPLEVRLWAVGQSRPLVFVPDSGGPSTALIRNRVGGWASAQLHLAGPLSAALQVPFLMGQHGDLSSLPPNLSAGASLNSGLGDVRATARVAILRQERAPIDAALQASLELPTAQSGSFLGDQSVQGEALGAAGRRFSLGERAALDVLGNVYLRLRPAREVLQVKTGSELGIRGALAFLPGARALLAPKRLMFEMEGASFLRARFAQGSVPAEWRGGIEYCVGPLALDFGAGSGLARGIGTPGFRVVGGIAFAPEGCGSSAARILPPVRVVDAPRPALKPASPSVAPPIQEAKTTASPPPAAANPAPRIPLAPLVEPNPALVAATPTPLPPLELPVAPKQRKPKERTLAKTDLPPLALPDEGPLAALLGDRIVLRSPIAFGAAAQLRDRSRVVLDDVARLLSEYPEVAVVQVAAPSPARADAVRSYLVGRGVPAGRISVSSGRSKEVELRVLIRR